MGEGEFGTLLSSVARQAGDLSRPYLARVVEDALKCDETDASLLVDALLGAHAVHQRRGAPAAEIALNIAEEAALKLGPAEQQVIVPRLTRLLEVESLATLSRAAQVLAEDEQTYCRARTLSDLRPVFRVGSEPPEAVGVVIRHTLQIRYHVDGPDTEGFFLTVDEGALRDLRAVIDRALSKGKALRTMAESSGLRIIDVEASH